MSHSPQSLKAACRNRTLSLFKLLCFRLPTPSESAEQRMLTRQGRPACHSVAPDWLEARAGPWAHSAGSVCGWLASRSGPPATEEVGEVAGGRTQGTPEAGVSSYAKFCRGKVKRLVLGLHPLSGAELGPGNLHCTSTAEVLLLSPVWKSLMAEAVRSSLARSLSGLLRGDGCLSGLHSTFLEPA